MVIDAGATGRTNEAPRASRVNLLVGAGLAVVVFLVVLADGHPSLLHPPPAAGDFYDVQARSLLHGHWDVPRASLAVEGFEHDGKVYEYFGPLPAVLRMPVIAVTDRLDGRLGQISMLLAFGVALVFTARLLARIRPLVLGNRPTTRAERLAGGIFIAAVGTGSVLVFLASRSWVYHEAELWGAALALGAIEFVIAFTVDPTRRHLIVASALIAATLLSRGSVGIGPFVALGLVFLARFWPSTRRLLGIGEPEGTVVGHLAVALALVVPIALYAYVNYAKFGTLFSLPFNAQLSTDVFPDSRDVLAANGGSMFNPSLIPTTAWQYLGLKPPQLVPLFPWITFGDPAHTFGGHRTAWTWTTSLPTTMPFLTLLGFIGACNVARRSRPGRASLAPVRAVTVGALLATLPTLSYAYIAHRYLSDLVPVVVLLAIVGMFVVLRWLRPGERPTGSGRRRAVVATLVGLLAFSIWCNVGLGVMYGRLLDGNVTVADRTAFVGFQYRLAERLGLGTPRLIRGSTLPAPVRDTVFVQGPCAGLYWSDGLTWTALEGGEATGNFRLRVRFPTGPTGWEPLVVSRGRTRAQWIGVRVRPDGRVQFALDGVFANRAVHIDDRAAHRVDVRIDTFRTSRDRGTVEVTVDGHPALAIRLPNAIIHERLDPLRDVTVGASSLPGVPTRFRGSITRLRIPTPLCTRLTGASTLSSAAPNT